MSIKRLSKARLAAMAALLLMSLLYGHSSTCFSEESPIFNSEQFLGVDWGSNLNNNSHFDCQNRPKQTSAYCAPKSEDTKFLGIKPTDVYYSVNWESKFDYVSMRIADRAEWTKLKDNLVEILGDQYLGDFGGRRITYTWQKDELEVELADNRPLADGEEAFLFLNVYHKGFYLPRGSQTLLGSCTRRPCNINGDDKCDAEDRRLLEASFGQCKRPGFHSYNSDADVNHDECITDADKTIVLTATEAGANGWSCPEPQPSRTDRLFQAH